jgi:hypothetical protein
VNCGLIGWNATSGGKNGNRWPGAIGLTTGLLQAAMGGVGLQVDHDGDEAIEYDVANLVVGSASMVLGIIALRRTAAQPPAEGIARESACREPGLRWTLAAGSAPPGGNGVRVALRF